MKILVISPVYSLAGVPLAQLRLAKSLAKLGHNVELIYGCKKYRKIEKIRNLNVRFFNKFRVLGMLFPLTKYLIIKKPDIIFSAEDHLNSIVVLSSLLAFSKAKITVSSRVTPVDTYKNSNILFSKGWFLKILFPIVQWRSNIMTCVSRDMVKQYKKIFPKSKQTDVYNIIKTSDAKKRMQEKINNTWFKRTKDQIIVASGKLAKWKGFDDLIKAAAILNEKKINFKLIIIGGGEEKKNLNKLIDKNNLKSKVLILEPVLNTLKYFYNADIFVLSSRVEGMPNVMIEAMMCNCTIVATDCPTGPKEIIGKNKYGYLSKMNNPKDLSKNIIKAIRKKIGIKKTKNLLEKFSEEKVIKKHFSLLKVNPKYWKVKL